MANKKRRLGRGLDALLGPQAKAPAAPEGPTSGASNEGSLKEVPIEFIQAGQYQPRKVFDQEKLEELAASIRAQGIMQPLVLRQLGDDKYEIIAGERRWRASQLAGLENVPAVIRDVDDEAVIAMSLIENIQREDLNPLEEAQALSRLLNEFDLTHQQVAEAVGKSRTAVTNLLRLTNLAPAVARMLAAGDLEMGHARCLLSLDDARQEFAAREICNRQLSVRQAEALVRKTLEEDKVRPDVRKGVDSDTRSLETRLSERLGQQVAIRHTAKGRGKVTISYASLDELDNILSHFGDLD